ncbi:hypothetical protein AB0M43_34935 [Longispora sp. NPDC051575]|uniref:hypothetical protein n=1 Tax=Longispora sp. NPDC051575 TaxID=3154943 RepID=UPI00343AFA54
MASRGYVGLLRPDGTALLRYVHHDATLDYLPLALARLWWTLGQNADATAQAVLAHDWAAIDPTATPDDVWGDQTLIPGVGRAIPPMTAEPITYLPGCDEILHGQYLFLLAPERPGVLLIADTSIQRLADAPVFDLAVGEHVQII